MIHGGSFFPVSTELDTNTTFTKFFLSKQFSSPVLLVLKILFQKPIPLHTHIRVLSLKPNTRKNALVSQSVHFLKLTSFNRFLTTVHLKTDGLSLKPKHSVHLTRSPSLSVRSKPQRYSLVQSTEVHSLVQSTQVHSVVQTTQDCRRVCPNPRRIVVVLSNPQKDCRRFLFKTFTLHGYGSLPLNVSSRFRSVSTTFPSFQTLNLTQLKHIFIPLKHDPPQLYLKPWRFSIPHVRQTLKRSIRTIISKVAGSPTIIANSTLELCPVFATRPFSPDPTRKHVYLSATNIINLKVIALKILILILYFYLGMFQQKRFILYCKTKSFPQSFRSLSLYNSLKFFRNKAVNKNRH